ncbi:MAG: hypothetical protein FWC71_09210 [Defluviitaleaceae bacterium]|nr:hypothetical protein [Defluviitaleaceae bacterium]
MMTQPEFSSFDPSYKELIFFMNAEEAEGHPEYVIAAWPNEENIHVFIEGINWAMGRAVGYDGFTTSLRRHVLTFEDFGLSYPLTKRDFVDNWEEVGRLFWRLHNEEQNIIRRASFRGHLSDDVIERFP